MTTELTMRGTFSAFEAVKAEGGGEPELAPEDIEVSAAVEARFVAD